MSEAIREADAEGSPIQDRPKKSEGSSGEPQPPPVAEPKEKSEKDLEQDPLDFLDEWTADQDYWEDYRTVNSEAEGVDVE